MAIEIVDLPIDSMVIVHSYVTVYHRVIWLFPEVETQNLPLWTGDDHDNPSILGNP